MSSESILMAISGSWDLFGCEASPPRESHTHHPSDFAKSCLEAVVGWVTIPCSAIQFSGSAASERVRSRRPSVGGAGFLVRPGDLVKRRVAPLSRGTALTSGSAGDGTAVGILARRYGAFRCRGTPKAPLADSLSPTSAPSFEVVSVDGVWMLRIPGPEARGFHAKVRKCSGGRNLGGLEAVWPRRRRRSEGSRRGRCSEIGSNGAGISSWTERRSPSDGPCFGDSPTARRALPRRVRHRSLNITAGVRRQRRSGDSGVERGWAGVPPGAAGMVERERITILRAAGRGRTVGRERITSTRAAGRGRTVGRERITSTRAAGRGK
jgi:hypothetical protein